MQSSIRGRFLPFALLAVLPVWAQQAAPSDVNPLKKIHLPIGALTSANSAAQPNSTPTGNGISYHGGPVMLGVTNVYYIWYGDWSVDTNALPILQNLASSIGGSPYFAINTTYTNGSGTAVSNAVSFNGSTTDNYSKGKNLTDGNIQTIVTAAITSGRLPSDANGVYFVLTSPDVQETSGFITDYCGWHTEAYVNGTYVKYAFVGDAATQGLGSCAEQTSASPNGDPAVDGMASVITHELEESVTDPLLNAWYDNSGNESADKCAWTFGKVFAAPNGSSANMTLGGRNYLIQQQWVNAQGGYCALALPPVLTSVSPNSGAAGAKVPVTIGGSNLTGASLSVSGTGVTAAVTSSSATQIAASLTIAASAGAGAHNVTVTTVGGTSASLPFTVTGSSAVPTISSINPSSAAQGAVAQVTLTGTNFTAQSAVGVGGSGVTAANVTVVSPTQIKVTLTVGSAAATGARTVSVSTTAGSSNTVSFTVVSAPVVPTLTSVSPATGVQGTSVPVTLTGTGFAAGASIQVSGTGVTVSNVVVTGSTQISATLAIAASAAVGPYSISVTTVGGTSGSAPFTVTAASLAPTLISMSPSSGSVNTSVNVTLTGTNFTPATLVRLGGLGASFSNVVVVSPTQITVTFILHSTGQGTHNVYVMNAAGKSGILPFVVN